MTKSLEAKLAALIAKCWTDHAFKAQFMQDPRTVLAQVLLDLPPNAKITVHEDSDQERHFVLPQPPADGFTAEDLHSAARNLIEPWFGPKESHSALHALYTSPALQAPYTSPALQPLYTSPAHPASQAMYTSPALQALYTSPAHPAFQAMYTSPLQALYTSPAHPAFQAMYTSPLQALYTSPAHPAFQAMYTSPALQALYTSPALQALYTSPELQALYTSPALQALYTSPDQGTERAGERQPPKPTSGRKVRRKAKPRTPPAS